MKPLILAALLALASNSASAFLPFNQSESAQVCTGDGAQLTAIFKYIHSSEANQVSYLANMNDESIQKITVLDRPMDGSTTFKFEGLHHAVEIKMNPQTDLYKSPTVDYINPATK